MIDTVWALGLYDKDVLQLVCMIEMGSYWSGRLRCALSGLNDGDVLLLFWKMEMGSYWSEGL